MQESRHESLSNVRSTLEFPECSPTYANPSRTETQRFDYICPVFDTGIYKHFELVRDLRVVLSYLKKRMNSRR